METGGQEGLPFDIVGVRRQGDRRDAAVARRRPDRLQALQAVDRAHADIQQHEIGLGRFEGRQCLFGARVAFDIVFRAENDRENVQDLFVIVNEQQPPRSRHPRRLPNRTSKWSVRIGAREMPLDHRLASLHQGGVRMPSNAVLW